MDHVCGHPPSLAVMSAETGEYLYCELCDAISGRLDAEAMEQEWRERAEKAEAELRSVNEHKH